MPYHGLYLPKCRDDPSNRYVLCHPTYQAGSIAVAPPKCRGSIQRWQLRPGLDLVIHDVAFRDRSGVIAIARLSWD